MASGCDSLKPKTVEPATGGASVVAEPPLKSEAWMQIATAADESRLARIGLAWQSALADARRSAAGEIRREGALLEPRAALPRPDRKSTRLNSSHLVISYAVFCL